MTYDKKAILYALIGATIAVVGFLLINKAGYRDNYIMDGEICFGRYGRSCIPYRWVLIAACGFWLRAAYLKFMPR